MADAEDATGTVDIASAVESIGADLFAPTTDPEPQDDAPADVPAPPLAEAAAPSAPAPTVPTVRTVPKSWPKEMHDHWGKVDPKVQEYWETREKQMLDGLDQYKGEAQFGKALRDVLAPFQPILQQRGLDAPRAVTDLMNAYVELTQGTMDQRWSAYQKLKEHFKLADPTGQQNGQPIDPHVQALRQQVDSIHQTLTAQQHVALEAARAKANQEVEAFASDPANVYFNEVHEDIVAELKAGHDLPTAYKRAVRANEVTWAKEVARIQTETEAKLKENARLQALPKQRAAGLNVKSRETRRTPTEPLGAMDDTIKDTLREIRARAS